MEAPFSFSLCNSLLVLRMELMVTVDSATLSYWLNWRVLVCAICLVASILLSIVLIRKYEGRDCSYFDSGGGESQDGNVPVLGNDVTWRPCIKEIPPVLLLAFRVTAFCLLLATFVVKLVRSGGVMFLYYSQWTFTLLTIYFGFGSVLSIFGCYQYHKRSVRGFMVYNGEMDAESGPYLPLMKEDNRIMNGIYKTSNSLDEPYASGGSDIWSYIFQVIFQVNAGAVMLTDSIYWMIIFPFLTIKDYDLSFMTVNIHTLNAVLFFTDAILNSLPIPWFRISYFLLWTNMYVIFQWAIHACESIWWPYPFLDLSATSAPLWYLLVGLMHIPCYSLCALFVQVKHCILSRWFPQSYTGSA